MSLVRTLDVWKESVLIVLKRLPVQMRRQTLAQTIEIPPYRALIVILLIL